MQRDNNIIIKIYSPYLLILLVFNNKKFRKNSLMVIFNIKLLEVLIWFMEDVDAEIIIQIYYYLSY